MKQIQFIFALLLTLAIQSQGQITHEHTYSAVSASYINLPLAGYKYYVMDVANSQCRLYNNDHSLWKTINLSVPANYYLCDIQFVTEDLFNSDNTIELLYVSYIYNTTLQYYTYDTRIADESGNVILSIPGAGYSNVFPAQDGSKLFMWIYNYAVSPYTVSTAVYSVPGKVSTSVAEYKENSPTSLRNAYPNPATHEAIISYSLPSHVMQAELKLYTMNGVLLKSYTIDHNFSSIRLNTSELPAGMYIYRIESGSFKSESFKLSVSK